MTVRMKSIEQYFQVVLFSMLVLTFESVNETVVCITQDCLVVRFITFY